MNLDDQSTGRRFGKAVVSCRSIPEFHRTGLALFFRKSIPCLQSVLHARLKVRAQNLAVGCDDNTVATSTGELQAANFAQEDCVWIIAALRATVDRDTDELLLDGLKILFPLRRLTAASSSLSANAQRR